MMMETENAEKMIPLKHLTNFWRTLETAVINCKINLILSLSMNYIITHLTSAETFAITIAKLCNSDTVY